MLNWDLLSLTRYHSPLKIFLNKLFDSTKYSFVNNSCLHLFTSGNLNSELVVSHESSMIDLSPVPTNAGKPLVFFWGEGGDGELGIYNTPNSLNHLCDCMLLVCFFPLNKMYTHI